MPYLEFDIRYNNSIFQTIKKRPQVNRKYNWIEKLCDHIIVTIIITINLHLIEQYFVFELLMLFIFFLLNRFDGVFVHISNIEFAVQIERAPPLRFIFLYYQTLKPYFWELSYRDIDFNDDNIFLRRREFCDNVSNIS